MRAFTIVLLFALALAIAAFAPVASADANITLYADMFCTQVIGDGPSNIPIPSSTTCQDLSTPTQPGSAIYFCYNLGGYNNFSLTAWGTVSDCSGDPDASITSFGKTGACVPLTIQVGGQSASAYAQLSCSSSSEQDGGMMLEMDDIARTLNVAKRAAIMQSNQHRGRLGMMPRMQHPMRRENM